MTKVPMVRPKSWKEIAKDAYQLIRKVAPHCLTRPTPFPLSSFIEFDLERVTGFSFSVQDLPPGIEAATDPIKKELILSEPTYIGLHAEEGRSRFTVAHEIGHIIEHGYLQSVFISGLPILRLNRGKIPPYKDPEAQANTFAAAFLLPQQAILNVKREMLTPEFLMEKCKVSYEAATIRMTNYQKY